MVISAVTILLCAVSMILTALFALSFAGLDLAADSVGPLTTQTLLALLLQTPLTQLLPAALTIAVGIAIDSSKYLFWSRGRHRGYAILSLGLVGFSWLASVAFFLAGDATTDYQARLASPQYQAYNVQRHALQQDIKSRERLLAQQLDSQYHEQWQKGQQQLTDIAERRQQLSQLLLTQNRVLTLADVEQKPSQQLFSHIATAIHVSVSTVRLFFFGVLALLIEASALGLLRLNRYHTQEGATTIETSANHLDPSGVEPKYDQDLNDPRRAQLIKDIVLGVQAPVLRQIKKAGYGMTLDEIKVLLSMLQNQGVLAPDVRNSYKLVPTRAESTPCGK